MTPWHPFVPRSQGAYRLTRVTDDRVGLPERFELTAGGRRFNKPFQLEDLEEMIAARLAAEEQ